VGVRSPVNIALGALLALALAGCGDPSADLFSVERSGADANANLRLVVNDGGSVTCNGSIGKAMDAEQLLEARELSRQLSELAQLGIELPPGRGSVLRYDVATAVGPLAFSDNSGDLPPAASRLMLFVSRLGEDVCGLRR
jgi:hypothetical protein